MLPGYKIILHKKNIVDFTKITNVIFITHHEIVKYLKFIQY